MSELNQQLLAKTNGKACADNIIISKNVRVTVLTERMLRVEFSPDGVFTDLPSQAVWYRDFGKVDFSYTESVDILKITTEKAEFVINNHNGSFKYAVIDGKQATYNSDHNLKGTTRTLDGTYGPFELKDGIISFDGVSIYDDSKTLLLCDDGMLESRKSGTKDIYVFAFGRNYIDWLNDFYKITGKPPLVPRYVLGNWWSRYRAYTQKEYEDLMHEFFRRDIPLIIATVDMDWHWVDIKKHFGKCKKNDVKWGSGWTGYSWNTELFPDYKAFLQKLHDMGLKVTLNLHPADGVRSFEDMYAEMADATGIDKTTEKTVEFDLTDKKFVNAYFDILHHPYENQGVDFWWIDWQQGTKSKKAGLDPLWLLNHYHYLDTDREERRPMILSRYAGIGSHRYPLGFSGDTVINWKVLNFQPYFTANAANCGYTWWSHEVFIIGGGGNIKIIDYDINEINALNKNITLRMAPIMKLEAIFSPIKFYNFAFRASNLFDNDLNSAGNFQLELLNRIFPSKKRNWNLEINAGIGFVGSGALAGHPNQFWISFGGTYEYLLYH